MPRFAIVIGIDRYANADWNLDAAGSDAVAFARWALEEGGVEPENLRLLLSTDAPPDDLPHKEADSANINDAILAFQNGAGDGGDRLYLYYAGHGLSAPGASAGFAQEPVLIPSDVAALPRDQGRCVGFSAIIPALNSVAPPEQFFFFDACRDFQLEDFRPGLGQAVGPWAPPRDPGAQSTQFVLYATAPGERAQEQSAIGQGVFGEALLEGLRGAPAAALWNSADLHYQITFSKLVHYVQRAVRERIKRAALKDHRRFMQVPEPLFIRGTDAVLLTRSREQIGNVELTVRVAPSAARQACRLQLLYPSPNGKAAEIASEGPPVGTTAKLTVLPGDYALVAEAPRYAVARQACPAYTTQVIDLPLKDAPEVVPAPEGVDCPQGRGRLEVDCPDPTALIVVDDQERALKGSGTCTLKLNLTPGIYRIRLLPAEGRPTEEHAEVLEGAATRLTLKAPEARLGADQLEMLDALDLGPSEDGYLRPADEVDPIASPRLGSLLGLAAFAAQAGGANGFDRLRQIGVQDFSGLAQGRAGLLVVIGAGGDEPVPGLPRDRFLAETEIIVRDLEGVALRRGRLDVLDALPTAAQAGIELTPGCITAELRVPGLAPTRYALTALQDRVTVLIAVAEDSGAVDVQQYLVPARPDAFAAGDYLQDPRNVRRLEQAQRYYARLPRLEPFDAHVALIEHELHVDDLLAGKWLDPLLGALAGYALIRAGNPDRYVGAPSPNGAGMQPSAMANMLNHFGGLPDAHVLAALCEPERRDEHFQAALELGLPVFAEGFRALYAWYDETRPPTERPLWLEPSALLVGSPWTAWVVERPVLAVSDGSFEQAPLDWAVLEQERAAVERTLPPVGRLQYRGSAPVGTAFAIAPGLVLAMQFELTNGVDGLEVCFADDGSDGAVTFAVEGVAAVVDRAGTQSMVALTTATSGGAFPQPLELAGTRPVPLEGRRVYAIGYPARDPRAPEELLARIFEDGAVRKRVQPGQLLGIERDESVLRHDCLTLGGNAGSPLVDVESGLVVGVHYAGRWAEFKRGDAVPLWPAADHPQLRPATWR
jgi:uncharacterized caspase-like protein